MDLTHVTDLEMAFFDYLTSACTPATGRNVVQKLFECELTDEARALELFFQRGSGSAFRMEREPWKGYNCVVSYKPPEMAVLGNLWFDPVELVTMVFVEQKSVPEPQNVVWVSIHPVYTWQFRVFLRCTKWEQVRKYFMNAPDLMNADRFAGRKDSSFVTEVYHEEAVAYAHWFGKYLSDQYILVASEETLETSQFANLLPECMRLWDEGEFSLSEFHRLAIGRDTLGCDPYDEWEKAENATEKAFVDKIVVEEWDRASDLGLSTIVRCDIGFIQQEPRMAYEFIELENSAPRSNIHVTE